MAHPVSTDVGILSYIGQYLSTQTFLIGFIILLVGIWLLRLLQSSPNLPPGPRGLPLVGILPSVIGKLPHEVFADMASKHGDIFTVPFGPTNIVVLNSAQAMREVLVDKAEAFSNRFVPKIWELAMGSKGGITFENGNAWKERRKWLLGILRNFGVGKKGMEYKINEEFRYLAHVLEEHGTESFNPQHFVNNAVANVTCSITFGERFEYSDPKFNDLLENLRGVLTEFSETSVGQIFPLLYYTPLYKKMRRYAYELKQFIQGIVSQHKENLNPDNTRDIIDMYLVESKRREEKGEEVQFSDDTVWRAIFEVFLGGTDAVTTSLMWGILLMALYPEIQQQVQDEIDNVIGSHRQPSMNDRREMPYTEAVILEVHRFRPAIPLGIPRGTRKATQIRGYTIPKDTTVFMNIWAVHFDPSRWEDPEKFDPSRFLSEDGKTLVNQEANMVFGLGSRQCAGQLLGKMKMFLLFANMLQRFTFSFPEGFSHDLSVVSGITLNPTPYKITAMKR